MGGVQHPVWLAGLYRVINLDDPPLGQNFAVQVPTVPEGVYWRVKGIAFRLVTSAAAGNRRVILGLAASKPDLAALTAADLRALYLIVSGLGTQNPAATADYTAIELGAASSSVQFQQDWPLDMKVQPGHYICSAITALDVGDQVTAVRLFVQEYIYVPPVDYISGLPDALKQLADSQLQIREALLALSAGGAPT